MAEPIALFVNVLTDNAVSTGIDVPESTGKVLAGNGKRITSSKVNDPVKAMVSNMASPSAV